MDWTERLTSCASSPLTGELVVTGVLAVAGLLTAGHVWVMPNPFLERDPSFSAVGRESTVSNTTLAVFCAVLPAASLVAVACVRARPLRGAAPGFFIDRARAAVPLAGGLLLGLAQALALTLLAVNVVKGGAARPRPSFFYLCNYQGYQDAVRSGDFTAYDAATAVGRVGDLSRCRADAATSRDAISSFPSGHSGLSFAGLGFLALALRWATAAPRARARDVFSVRAALAVGAPLALATWIAITRVRDHRHFPVDIGVGGALGGLAAALAWRNLVLAEPSRTGDAGDKREPPLSPPGGEHVRGGGGAAAGVVGAPSASEASPASAPAAGLLAIEEGRGAGGAAGGAGAGGVVSPLTNIPEWKRAGRGGL